MVDYTAGFLALYNSSFNYTGTSLTQTHTYSEPNGGNWEVGDPTSGHAAIPSTFAGTTDLGLGGELYPVLLRSGGDYVVLVRTPVTPPATMVLTAQSFTACFGMGTQIATPTGATSVEALSVGDHVLTHGGKSVPVLWVGRQRTLTVAAAHRTAAVRIKAGALGAGLPETDLVVTGDHGLCIEGLIINAAALVNHDTIAFVPVEELDACETYYHVELENHDVIIANGAPAETFLDVPHRRMFDNFDEYLELYGAERLMREMNMPRIAAARLVPEYIRARFELDYAKEGLKKSA